MLLSHSWIVNYVAKPCNFHIWGLRHIHHSISRDVANTITACIADIYLDYCNTLLHGELRSHSSCRIQNKLARVICNVTTSQQHTINLLCNLHWLTIMVMIATCATKHTSSINQTICRPHWSHTCHAVTKICWDELADSTKVAYQNSSTSFSSAAPTGWNRLPLTICNNSNIRTFKSHLKTHLFLHDFLAE